METTLGFWLVFHFVFFIYVSRKAIQLFWKIKCPLDTCPVGIQRSSLLFRAVHCSTMHTYPR